MPRVTPCNSCWARNSSDRHPRIGRASLVAPAGPVRPAGAPAQAHRHPAAGLAHTMGAVRGQPWLAASLSPVRVLSGHRADAFGRLRHQRLRRPRLRRRSGSHRRPAAGPQGHRAVGGRGRLRRAQPAGSAPGLSLRAAGLGAGRGGGGAGRQLSVLQAFLRHSPSLSGHCLRFRHPDGLCRVDRYRPAVGLDHAAGQHLLDGGL